MKSSPASSFVSCVSRETLIGVEIDVLLFILALNQL